MSEWIQKSRQEVRRWNVDENAERSIDIFHVHVYFQVVDDEDVGMKKRQGEGEGRERDSHGEEAGAPVAKKARVDKEEGGDSSSSA